MGRNEGWRGKEERRGGETEGTRRGTVLGLTRYRRNASSARAIRSGPMLPRAVQDEGPRPLEIEAHTLGAHAPAPRVSTDGTTRAQMLPKSEGPSLRETHRLTEISPREKTGGVSRQFHCGFSVPHLGPEKQAHPNFFFAASSEAVNTCL